MTDCPQCEYHKNRAAMWRAEAYAQAGHDIIERPWTGLTDEEIEARAINFYNPEMYKRAVLWAQEKLKERNQ